MSSLGRSPRDSPIRNFGRTPPSAASASRGSRARSSEPTLPAMPATPTQINTNTHTNGSNGLSHGRPSTGALSQEQVRYTSLSSLMSPTSRSNGNGWVAREPDSPTARRFTGGSSSPPRFGDSGMSRIAPPPKEAPRLSTLQLIALTVSMGGSQIAWSVELGYGTPYLLGLGLSEELTSLVWLAGPISGLVVQPLIGAISDSSTSRYRRRYWVIMSTGLLVISGLGLAFTQPVAKAIVDIIGGGQGDWDPNTQKMVKKVAILIAVFCFYCLDFALNGLQAALRCLVFDVTPSEQINSANAWNGRFNHIGNIVGFTLGFLNLNKVPVLRLLGGDQFRKLCVVALVILIVTVWITCATFEESERPQLFGRRSKFRDMINTIHEAVLSLPRPVRRMCMVQIAAFMGWFPFLFYSTTYVAEVMAHEIGREPDRNYATRVGSFALLIHSFVAIIAGTVLPKLADRDRRLLKPTEVIEEDAELESPESAQRDQVAGAETARVRELVRVWKADAARDGRPLKLPRMPFMLRNVWTFALVLFFVLMMSTFFITTVWQATVMIALVGICWAVACWVPFAMMMEFLKELEQKPAPVPGSGISQTVSYGTMESPAGSLRSTRSHPESPTRARPARPGLKNRSYSATDLEGAGQEYITHGPVAGGTIMGIHNLAIVLPQFIVAIVASVIFRVADGDPDTDPGLENKTGVAWVLRFGGLMALVGALICRRVPPTRTEKAMRRRLAEMREEAEDPEPEERPYEDEVD